MKKTRTRIGSILIALALILTLLPVSALAVTEIVTDENTLKTAVAQGGDIQLGENISLTEGLVITDGVSVTIDLNGNTLRNSDNSLRKLITVSNGATLTIQDSNSSGKISYTGNGNNYYGIYVDGGSLNFVSGALECTSATAIAVAGTGQVTVGSENSPSQPSISASCAFAGFGTTNLIYCSYGTPAVTIRGGTFQNTNAYASSSYALLNIAAGTCTITGGTFNGTCTDGTSTGAAAIFSSSSKGCTVSGGRFSPAISNTVIAPGYQISATVDNEGYYTIVELTQDNAPVQLTYGGTTVYCADPSAAMAAAAGKADAVVTILKDVTTAASLDASQTKLVVNSGATLDCSSFITVSKDGSTGERVLNNGTINASSGISGLGGRGYLGQPWLHYLPEHIRYFPELGQFRGCQH